MTRYVVPVSTLQKKIGTLLRGDTFKYGLMHLIEPITKMKIFICNGCTQNVEILSSIGCI